MATKPAQTPKLLTGQALINAIQSLFRHTRGRSKYVAVAYIGDDAVRGLGGRKATKGTKIYCWPQPGSTSPNGINELTDAGAKVYFVPKLHSKIYWTGDGGAIIGSANLSTNALTPGGTIEAGIYVDSDAVSQQFLKNLNKKKLPASNYNKVMDDLSDGWNKRKVMPKLRKKNKRNAKQWIHQKYHQPILLATCVEVLKRTGGIRKRLLEEGELNPNLKDYFSSDYKVPEGRWVLEIVWFAEWKTPRLYWFYCERCIRLYKGDTEDGAKWLSFQKQARRDYPFSLNSVASRVKKKLLWLSREKVQKMPGIQKLTRKSAKELGII